jgi:uncharacterized protein YqfB (UPF0267 family)
LKEVAVTGGFMERPILFSTPMVQAILAGKKTMTRRVIKQKYDNTHIEWKTDKYGTQLVEIQNDVEGETFGKNPDGTTWHKLLGYRPLQCPYGKPGDILWVRETWGNYSADDPESNAVYNLYRADYPQDAKGYWYEPEHINFCDFPRWRPSIHMPRTACRIRLKITDVRAERLQKITEEDARAEGIDEQEIIKAWNSIYKHKGGFKEKISENLVKLFGTNSHIVYVFKSLWNNINYERGYGWDTNPWVWVVVFEKI